MRRFITWTLLAALLMLGGPWLALQVADKNAMAVCLLLFFAVNPAFCAVCGGIAGKNIRQLWALPVIAAILFVAGAWLFLDWGEPAFLLYGGGYLMVGGLAMLISAIIKKRARKDECASRDG